MKAKYSITELLALRGNAAVDIGQFTIYALENNLLRRNKSVPNTEREPTSTESRQTGRSTTTSEDSFPKPSSQPPNDVQDNSTESDSGFVKFLKQHTSPKHQRVTPGGKVVHVDGHVPIPEFKPPSVKTSDDCPQKIGKDTAKVIGLQGASKTKKTAQSSGVSSNSNSSKLDTSHVGPPYERIAIGPAGITTATCSEETVPQIATVYPSIQSLQQLQVPIMGSDVYRQQPLALAQGFCPILQVTQTGQETLGTPSFHTYPQLLLPDTTAWYQTAPQSYVNQNPMLQNLSHQQPAPLLATVWPTTGKQGAAIPSIGFPDSQVTVPASYPVAGPNNLTSQVVPPLTSYPGSLPATYLADQNTQRSLQDLTKEYQSLSSQLANLDRYMAIHTFEMDAETKKSLVEQRRALVKDLDMARRYKEHLESNIKLPSANIETAPVSGFQQDPGSGLGLASHPTLPRLIALDQSAEYPTSSLPLALNSINTVPLQFSQTGYVPVIPTLANWGEYSYNAPLSQDTQFIPQTYSFINQPNDLNTVPQSKNRLSQQSRTDSSSSTSASIINVNQLHRQIEEAARRGEPIDGLFEELARMTVAQGNIRRLGSFNGPASDRTSLHQNSSTTQSGEGSHTETSDNLGTGSGASKSSSSSWMVVDGQASSATSANTTGASSGISPSPRKGSSQNQSGSHPEKDLVMTKHPLRSLRHSRDTRSRGFSVQYGDRKAIKKQLGGRSVVLTPWVGRTEQDIAASKACAPVISRVNAHGFLPSFDGANDFYDSHKQSQRSMILIDLESDDNVSKKNTENQPWYLKVPRPNPTLSEVHQFFLHIEEEERQMIHRYQMQSLGERGISRN